MTGPSPPRGLGGFSAAVPSGQAPAGQAAYVPLWLAQAIEHHRAGRFGEAEALYKRILSVDPRQVQALYYLGLIAHRFGWHEAAVELIGAATVVDPHDDNMYGSLAVALEALGRLDEAEPACRRAVELRPDFAPHHDHLGMVVHLRGRLDEAVSHHRRAIELEPASAEAHNNLGNAFQALGRLDAAAEAYLRAVELKPDLAYADCNRLLCLTYSPALSPEALLAEHRDWDRRHAPATTPKTFANDPDPERRLRIGLVSADFLMHPVGFFLARVLAARARSAVELFCYDNTPAPDAVTAELRALADQWRPIAGLSDDDAEAMIREDRIDILVDLAGHTGDNRLLLFARKPAPVQASWLGYPSTTGLSAIDYLIMDAVAVPPGEERWCSEAVVRLPHGRFCYAPPDYAPAVADRPDVGPVVFGSFNNLTKVGPEVVRLWAEVLKAAPGSRLMLKSKSLAGAETRDRWTGAFAEAGIGPERLELRGLSPHLGMLAEYGDIDIALDPFPFCGGTTSCEALWMGVPVVTLPGERPASRQTLGFLQTLGLDELVADSEADYVRIASGLAADPARRAELRRELRPRMAASPLCDGARFAAALEAAFRRMWRGWCAGEPAAGFDVPPAETPG